MKTIGLIGGMSWESTTSYYQMLNQGIKEKLGGLNSAKIVLNSVNFQEIEHFQTTGNWQQAGEVLADAAKSIAAGGADFMLICTNTMHKVAEQVSNAADLPLLHIADATGEQLTKAGIKKIGLLGTQFTMEQDFYKQRLVDNYDLQVITPNKAQRDRVHNIIYQELCLGEIKPSSKAEYLAVIEDLRNQGAEGVILGCTEIGLLVQQQDCAIPLFDTTAIHAEAAVEFALD